MAIVAHRGERGNYNRSRQYGRNTNIVAHRGERGNYNILGSNAQHDEL